MPIPKSKTTSATPDAVLWQVHLPKELNNYLDSLLLGRGYRQLLCETMLTKFADALREVGIASGWDPENEPKILSVLESLSYGKPTIKPKSKSRKS